MELREGAGSATGGAGELVLVGSGAMPSALAKLAHMLKFRVTLIDPLLRLDQFPEADCIVHVLDFSLIDSRDRYVVVASRGRCDEEDISIVPCGVDLHAFRPDGPADERRPGMHRIVCVSRLVERKGIDDVVRALPSLPSCELVIAGGGSADSLEHDPVAVQLRSLAASIGVADRVELRGPADRASVARLMRSADVVCCTPWYEPFGIVPLEAMACGTPVIASAVGGLVDGVVDGVTGLHVPPRRPDAGSPTAIAAIVDRPTFQRRLGAGGHRPAHGAGTGGRASPPRRSRGLRGGTAIARCSPRPTHDPAGSTSPRCAKP